VSDTDPDVDRQNSLFEGRTGVANIAFKGRSEDHFTEWEIGSQVLWDGTPVVRVDIKAGGLMGTLTFTEDLAQEFLETFRDALDEVRLAELKRDRCAERVNSTQTEETGKE